LKDIFTVFQTFIFFDPAVPSPQVELPISISADQTFVPPRQRPGPEWEDAQVTAQPQVFDDDLVDRHIRTCRACQQQPPPG
jgi:hypothetical protein